MENFRVTMVCPDLARGPSFETPPGYAVRGWRPGDREAWLRIHELAEREAPVSAEVYARDFGTDEAELARRQLFLLDAADREIGTVTAWFGNLEGQALGRIHWLAIIPDYQGRGLSRVLLARACHRLIELGHARAYLTTHSAKLRAIRLYRHHGFQPLPRTGPERAFWKTVTDAA